MAKGKDTAKLTDRQARDLLRKVTKVKPLISREEMTNIERVFHTEAFGVSRRLALCLAIQDGQWFKQLSADREMAVTVAAQFDAIKSAREVLRYVADLLDAAHLRAATALSKHADALQILRSSTDHAVVCLPSAERDQDAKARHV